MVEISSLVGANIEGIEDKVLGFMTIFSVSDYALVDSTYFLTILKKYSYESLIERVTPQKAFKRAMGIIKKQKEVLKTKIRGKEVEIEATYDVVETGKTVYLIRKLIVQGEISKKSKVDTDRLAYIRFENGKIVVEPIPRHIGSNRVELTEEQAKEIENMLNKEFQRHLNTYQGQLIRAFLRDRILRDRCNAIPFVGRGGTWFVMNNEISTTHLANLKEIMKALKEATPYRVNLVVIPLFDSEDVREKIKEDINREVITRYKKLLNMMLHRIINAKSGDQIEKVLTDILGNEDELKKMIEEYAHLIKSSLTVELSDISELKDKIIKTIDDKEEQLGVDLDKVKLLVKSIGTYKNEENGIVLTEKKETETGQEEPKIKLLDDNKIKLLANDLVLDQLKGA